MALTPEVIYLRLGQLVGEMPNFAFPAETTPEEKHRWLGRAVALLESTGDMHDAVDALALKRAAEVVDHADGVVRRAQAKKVALIMERALARAELKAPAAAQGTFISAGDSFDAFAAVGKVFGMASADLLIVDPYADARLLTDYAVLAPERGVIVRVMADHASHKPSLKPAAENWAKQFDSARPLDVRLAAAGSLHDRLIVVDGSTAFSLGQSFNKLAERAHTSILRVDAETAALKIKAYDDLWKTAKPL